MLFKLHRPSPTFPTTCLILSLVVFLTINILHSFPSFRKSIPFIWSAQFSALPHPSINNASCNPAQPTSYPLQPPEQPHLHSLITNYITFHATARACLQDPTCTQKPKVLVARCSKEKSCAGLGDRLRGVLFSFTIALITNRVLFLHQLSAPFPLQSGLVPYAIDWTLPSTLLYNQSWPHLEWNRCRKGGQCEGNAPALTDFDNFDNVGPGVNMLTDDIVQFFGDKPVVSITSRNRYYRVSFILQNPYLKHTFGDLANYIVEGNFNWYRLLFQPAPPIKQLMKRVQFTHDYVSVHIRTGVDVDEAESGRFWYWSSHEENTVESALRCVEKVAHNMTNIFLASDSVKTKELFKNKAQERGYHVHLLEKKTLHSDRFRGALKNEPWDTVCEGFLTVFSDLFMLSGGKTLIKTGSHFSRLAWFLSKGQRAFQLEPNGECKLLTKRNS